MIELFKDQVKDHIKDQIKDFGKSYINNQNKDQIKDFSTLLHRPSLFLLPINSTCSPNTQQLKFSLFDPYITSLFLHSAPKLLLIDD